MTTAELKTKLKKEIEKTDDFETLELLQILLLTRKTPVPELTDWQKKRIHESETQIKEGKFYTDEEVNDMVNKWLEEK